MLLGKQLSGKKKTMECKHTTLTYSSKTDEGYGDYSYVYKCNEPNCDYIFYGVVFSYDPHEQEITNG